MIPMSKPSITRADVQTVARSLGRGWASANLYVRAFEKEFADYHDIDFAVMTSSGSSALDVIIKALGIGPGDEVIVPDLTYYATMAAVVHAGATVSLCDVNLEDGNIDVNHAAKLVTDKTKAIIPVHLMGKPVDMVGVAGLAKYYKLFVVEDAAEALGSVYWYGRGKNYKCGTMGHASIFSFYGNKVITSGEGGAILTPRSDVYARANDYRDACRYSKNYDHYDSGYNAMPSEMQGALAYSQFRKVQLFLTLRKRLAAVYDYNLPRQWKILGGRPLGWNAWGMAVRHVSGELPSADPKGIEFRRMFTPLHLQPSGCVKLDGTYPNSTSIYNSTLLVPLYADMTDYDVLKVCRSLNI